MALQPSGPIKMSEIKAFVGSSSNSLRAYNVIAKAGTGNTKFDTQAQLESWIRGKDLSGYIFEKFYNYSREYRLHVTKDGCFYTCRKLVKNDAPEDTWQKHDDVCNWVLEDNPSFKKPKNWDAIVADCIKAKDALGLDICAFDVGVQGAKDGVERENPEWIIFESCSAPSFGEITGQEYPAMSSDIFDFLFYKGDIVPSGQAFKFKNPKDFGIPDDYRSAIDGTSAFSPDSYAIHINPKDYMRFVDRSEMAKIFGDVIQKLGEIRK